MVIHENQALKQIVLGTSLISDLVDQDGFKRIGSAQLRKKGAFLQHGDCLLYTSPSPRDREKSRMPSSA